MSKFNNLSKLNNLNNINYINNLNKFNNLSKLNGGFDFNEVAEKTNNGLSFIGKIASIMYIILCIIGIFIFFYGIKLFFTNESNWKSIDVIITKINSKDNNTCDSTILTTSQSSKYGITTNQNIIYNCSIHYMFNNNEITTLINNAVTNYNVGQTITVFYDSNNMNNPPVINKIFMSKSWWIFILIGLIMTILFGSIVTCIYTNKTCSSFFGGLLIWDTLFNN